MIKINISITEDSPDRYKVSIGSDVNIYVDGYDNAMKLTIELLKETGRIGY